MSCRSSGFLPTQELLFEVLEGGLDPFGKDVIGFKGGDLLYKWQGKELTMKSVQAVLTQYAMSASEGSELQVIVLRKNADGEYEEKELKGKLKEVPVEVEHTFTVNSDANAKQLKLRKAWLGESTQ